MIIDYLSVPEESRPQHVFDNIDPAAEQEDMDDLEDLEKIDQNVLPSDTHTSQGPEKFKFKGIDIGTEEEMLAMARKLSIGQRLTFSIVVDFAMKMKISKRFPDFQVIPPRIIVHGKKNTFIF